MSSSCWQLFYCSILCSISFFLFCICLLFFWFLGRIWSRIFLSPVFLRTMSRSLVLQVLYYPLEMLIFVASPMNAWKIFLIFSITICIWYIFSFFAVFFSCMITMAIGIDAFSFLWFWHSAVRTNYGLLSSSTISRLKRVGRRILL